MSQAHYRPSWSFGVYQTAALGVLFHKMLPNYYHNGHAVMVAHVILLYSR